MLTVWLNVFLFLWWGNFTLPLEVAMNNVDLDEANKVLR